MLGTRSLEIVDWQGFLVSAIWPNTVKPFKDVYTDWMRTGHVCTTILHFRLLGELLVRLANALGAPRSAKALDVKFGPQRLPWHASAVGIDGIPAQNMSLERLHEIFDRTVFGRGLMSHAQYFQAVVANADHLSEHMPQTVSDMQVGGFPPTALMLEKAVGYLNNGGFFIKCDFFF